MTPQLIIPKLIAVLQADDNLAFYVPSANVLEGVREGIVSFPTIIIETDGDRLLEQTYPWEKIVLQVKIGGFIQEYDKNVQLSGVNGLLQLKNDIKRAISADSTLGLADVYDTVWVGSRDDNRNYPVRGFEASVNITYRQNRLTRA